MIITNSLIIDNALSEEQKELLDGFMNLLKDDKLEPSAQNPYLITHLKKVEQTITPAKIKESLVDFNYIQELYRKLSGFYDFNLVSNELINYYAIWILKAEHIQFNDISDMRNKPLNVLSFENVDDANRKVIALINSLPLSGIYLDNPEQVNTSSDGQKFNVGIPFLNATHPPKYFEMDKIVSAYSSVDAKGRLSFGAVHSAKERESNFVPDALLNNPDVVSDTHATHTHTHGYTEIVFGICYLLGVEFTPRIKNYHEQILYTFKDMPPKGIRKQKV